MRFRPRVFMPPDSEAPIDFYKDYIAHSDLYHFTESTLITQKLNRAKLDQIQYVPGYYLVHRGDQGQGTATVYGRVYRETVGFQDTQELIHNIKLTFLKYSFTFPRSGLPEKLPFAADTLLRLIGLSPDDWHQLDHYTAVTMVLDENQDPIAVLLAQHNHHRSYLVGKHVALSSGRLVLDVAKRSNELYLSSDADKPLRHRTIRWSLYRKYLLSGDDGPFFKAWDVTYGPNAGGRELSYTLSMLSPCDPFYRAKIFLGEPRPFLGFYVGRDGPPGADYYTVPELLSLGKLLKFSYYHEGQQDDIEALDRFIDIQQKKMNITALVSHGEKKFIQDLFALRMVLANRRRHVESRRTSLKSAVGRSIIEP